MFCWNIHIWIWFLPFALVDVGDVMKKLGFVASNPKGGVDGNAGPLSRVAKPIMDMWDKAAAMKA